MSEANQRAEFLDAYDRYADAIYRHCYFRVFSRDQAEELVQETFFRAWQYCSSSAERRIENWRAFLYRIAKNLIIDRARKKKEASLDEMLARGSLREPASQDHEDMKQRALMQEVMRGFKYLGEEEQSLLVLRYIDNLDPKEIADILDTSANVVSVRLNRAVYKLKIFLAPHA